MAWISIKTFETDTSTGFQNWIRYSWNESREVCALSEHLSPSVIVSVLGNSLICNLRSGTVMHTVYVPVLITCPPRRSWRALNLGMVSVIGQHWSGVVFTEDPRV